VFIRKAVEALTEKDLAMVPVPAPYGRISDPAKLREMMLDSVRAWWVAGRPKDAMPRMPNGDVIRKVRVQTTDKVAVRIRSGAADPGEMAFREDKRHPTWGRSSTADHVKMARVDVFRAIDRKGKVRFHLVPIYPHQIATLAQAPDRAIVANTRNESEWTSISGSGFEFQFSFYQNSILCCDYGDEKIIIGYNKGVDRSNAKVLVAGFSGGKPQGVGTKTLKSFERLQIDRLGNIHKAPREARTWRGAVCT
jgi:CRISPR-associated endonuclease Csn1